MNTILLKSKLNFGGEADVLSSLINKCDVYEYIVIFGAGIGGKKTIDVLHEYGYEGKVVGFCDNAESKKGTLYYGYKVYSAEEIHFDGKLLWLISSTAYDRISKQLIELGYSQNDIYYFQPAGISFDSRDEVEIKENIEQYNWIFQKLSDAKSKQILVNLLNYRISKDTSILMDMMRYVDDERCQYFDMGLLCRYKFETGFVDAGAYTGDTALCFFSMFPEWKGKYYALEAGRDIYETLVNNVYKLNKDVECLNFAVWKENETLSFDNETFGNGAGGVVFNASNNHLPFNTIDAKTIDYLFYNKQIDFIKMDIEGSERNALVGSQETIRRCSPILTICVYHKRVDLWDIPKLIEKIHPNVYEYYLRQYRFGQSETVLYALPKCRKRKDCNE